MRASGTSPRASAQPQCAFFYGQFLPAFGVRGLGCQGFWDSLGCAMASDSMLQAYGVRCLQDQSSLQPLNTNRSRIRIAVEDLRHKQETR